MLIGVSSINLKCNLSDFLGPVLYLLHVNICLFMNPKLEYE